MIPVSVIIITRNLADIHPACINQAKLISDDIVVIYNGNKNDENNACGICGCRLYHEKWDGYGVNKNKGIAVAKYNWILSIDADEIPDDDLIASLHSLKYENPDVVYDIKFKSYLGEEPVKFGRWGMDHHIRLFNRDLVRWSETMVHETLILPNGIKIKKMSKGRMRHYSVKDIEEYKRKSTYYAKLSAEKYLRTGKHTGALKLYLSPLFGFLKNYIIYLGFLDGRKGWDIAITMVKNTRLKYRLLSELQTTSHEKQIAEDCLRAEYQ